MLFYNIYITYLRSIYFVKRVYIVAFERIHRLLLCFVPFTQSQDRVDIINSTLGKAMGGASGGYTTGPKEVVDILRNKARPYLFSNSIAPPLVAAAQQAFDLVSRDTTLRDKVEANTTLFRKLMSENGFNVPGEHPIVPVMLGDAKLAGEFAREMVKEGIYVVAFSYPVVPMGKARIRVQISAGHDEKAIRACAKAFAVVKKRLNA